MHEHETVRIGTGISTEIEAADAVREAWAALTASLGAHPHYVFTAATATHDITEVSRLVAALAPDAVHHGYTTCHGVMTDDGFHSSDGHAVALWGIRDEGGGAAYGSALVPSGDEPGKAAAIAVRLALADAGRAGESPELVWLTATPGHEEAIIEGIESVVGQGVPILGGSAADNTVSGDWSVFRGDRVHPDGIMVSVLMPSAPVSIAFSSGYIPQSRLGVVTKATDRTIFEIDGRPAAPLYDGLCGGILHDRMADGGVVLSDTTLHPIGRVVGQIGGTDYYQLTHIHSVGSDGSLGLFARISEGEEVIVMGGSRDALVKRASQLTRDAMTSGGFEVEHIAGALIQYCAGCMLTVTDRMPEVASSLSAVLGARPFVGTFSFGEQGCFVGGENRHGNLMMSAIVFGTTPRAAREHH